MSFDAAVNFVLGIKKVSQFFLASAIVFLLSWAFCQLIDNWTFFTQQDIYPFIFKWRILLLFAFFLSTFISLASYITYKLIPSISSGVKRKTKNASSKQFQGYSEEEKVILVAIYLLNGGGTTTPELSTEAQLALDSLIQRGAVDKGISAYSAPLFVTSKGKRLLIENSDEVSRIETEYRVGISNIHSSMRRSGWL